MHIEKNICDNVLGTLMNVDGKTKDNSSARRDLALLGIKKDLRFDARGAESDDAELSDSTLMVLNYLEWVDQHKDSKKIGI